MLWLIGSGLLVIWLVLKFLFHQGGFVHVLFLCGVSVLVVQFAAYRKTQYQKTSSRRGGSV
jgi:hypothetical protein